MSRVYQCPKLIGDGMIELSMNINIVARMAVLSTIEQI